MTCAYPSTTNAATTTALIVDAVRAWRKARDNRLPVQPTIHQSLTGPSCGVLAPVFDSLLSLYEACSGRRFQVGGETHVTLSGDEHRLLNLLKGSSGCEAPVLDASAIPSLVPALRIALRSARIMTRLALDSNDGLPSPGLSRCPIANDGREHSRHAC